MNSPNKLYEELLKEHPELKNSQEDIPEIISSLQKINPTVQVDEDFKLSLKKRLDTIANYNPSKSPGYFGFLKYFIPVFTFGFAIFGFVYFSQDFKQPVQQEIGGFESELLMMDSDGGNNIQSDEPESLMQMSDIQLLEQLDQSNENVEGNKMMLRGTLRGVPEASIEESKEETTGEAEAIIEESIMLQSEPASLKVDNPIVESKNLADETADDLSDEILDEITPMLFSMPEAESNEDDQGGISENASDEMVEEIFQDLSENILEDTESIESEPSAMKMILSEEIIDEFKNICIESNGLIKDLSEGERICILEKTSCLESDFKLKKCLMEK